MTRAPKDTGPDRGGNRAMAVLLAACILGLATSICLSYLQSQHVGDRLAVLEEYVEGRGEYRDAEADRLEDRIDQVVCDILGEFPAGDERADRLRVRYQCPIPDQPGEEAP